MKNIRKPFLWIGLPSLLLVACFVLILTHWKNEPTFSLPPPPTSLPPLSVLKEEQKEHGKRVSDKDLGISFILPADFEVFKNKSSLGFDYSTILSPELKDTESRKSFEKKLADCDVYCIVIRPSASLFPLASIKNNEDIKTYINDLQDNPQAGIIKEWEQSGVKFLRFYMNGKYNQIISVESASPANFIAVILRFTGEYAEETFELAKSIQIIGPSKYTKPQSSLVTYTNKRLGIQFKYPSEWGPINYTPCHDQTEPIIEPDNCMYISLGFVDLNASFLSAHSVLAKQYPPERGGYWGDGAGNIINENFVANYCNARNSAKCKVTKNSHNVLVARSIEDACTEGGCLKDVVMYYIKAQSPEYLGIIFSTNGLKYQWGELRYPPIPDMEKKMDDLIDTLKFL
ncbi:MAG: hypothetical protein AAB606_03075 [Patescibacteria group bacterium]